MTYNKTTLVKNVVTPVKNLTTVAPWQIMPVVIVMKHLKTPEKSSVGPDVSDFWDYAYLKSENSIWPIETFN